MTAADVCYCMLNKKVLIFQTPTIMEQMILSTDTSEPKLRVSVAAA